MNIKETPLVAIIMPTYNTGKYISECLDSLIAQTYKNFQCYIVNDGSTDNTAKILDAYKNKYPDKLKILTKPNGGVSSARNLALDSLEKSDVFPKYLCFIDSDDKAKPNWLESFVNAMENQNLDFAVCGYSCFDRNGIEKRKESPINLGHLNQERIINHYYFCNEFSFGKYEPRKHTNSTFGWGLFNRCFLYEKIKHIRFDETLKYSEDMEYFAHCVQNLNSGKIIPENLYLYRLRAGSLSHNEDIYLNNAITNINIINKLIKTYCQNKTFISTMHSVLFREVYYALRKAIITKNDELSHKYFNYALELRDKFSDEIPICFKSKYRRLSFGYFFNSLYINHNFKRKQKRDLKRNKNNIQYFN